MAEVRTESERLFEEFCKALALPLQRIQEARTRRPDYRLCLPKTDLIVEVKELEATAEEKAVIKHAEESPGTFNGEDAVPWWIPGHRIRKKISNAVPQLKALSEGRLPTMLLIYDPIGFWPEHLDDYAVKVAMYGIEEILISSQVAPEGGALVLDRWHGGRRKLTPNHNTSLSAVGILKRATVLQLDIFHNWYAANPLPPASFAATAVRHFHLQESPESRLAGWHSTN